MNIKSEIPYWYELPTERIAQRPIKPYDLAKLLFSKSDSNIIDSEFCNIGEFLNADDVLIFNNTRVVPARVFAKIKETDAQVELLFIRNSGRNWECLAKPLKRLKPRRTLLFADGSEALITKNENARAYLDLQDTDEEQFFASNGNMPIPPYIRSGRGDAADREDYQTHFAKYEGSIAAPTASLHFTPSLVEGLLGKGIEVFELTLHVGTASFLPLTKSPAEELQKPGSEELIYDADLIEQLQRLRKAGRRVIAVGTTAVRALESMVRMHSGELAQAAATELFITPGFEFQIVDGMVTNFHQPGTSHLLLVEAFVGRKRLDQIYQHALNADYRFLSYGDGMLLT